MRSFIATAALTLMSLPAAAVTIDFGGLQGATNGSPLTSYIEDGFTVTTTSPRVGSVVVSKFQGNATPSLLVGSSSLNEGRTGAVTITSGGSLFSFTSFDLASFFWTPIGPPNPPLGTTTYTVTGFNGDDQAFTFGTTISGLGATGWSTILSPSDYANLALTSLVISLTTNFENNGANFDNIVLAEVAPVPVPAALPLFATGLAGLGLMARRRRRRKQAA